MFALALTALLPLLAFAQNETTASAYDINLIEANFQNAQLVPQLLPTFSPQGTLDVAFNGDSITIGENLTATAYPTLTVMPAAGAQNIDTSLSPDAQLYTIAMVDANPVGTDESTVAQTRHWLVNNVGLSGDQPPYAINYTGATSITDYAGPGPFAGSGSHRYVVLFFYQPTSFSPPANLSMAGTPLGTYFVEEYASEAGLGPVVAANYFQVENGVATITVPSTTAVNTATLGSTTPSSAAASGASLSGSAIAGSVTMSMGGSSAATPSASATSKAAAGKIQNSNFGVGLAVGAVGLVGALLGASLGF